VFIIISGGVRTEKLLRDCVRDHLREITWERDYLRDITWERLPERLRGWHKQIRRVNKWFCLRDTCSLFARRNGDITCLFGKTNTLIPITLVEFLLPTVETVLLEWNLSDEELESYYLLEINLISYLFDEVLKW